LVVVEVGRPARRVAARLQLLDRVEQQPPQRPPARLGAAAEGGRERVALEPGVVVEETQGAVELLLELLATDRGGAARPHGAVYRIGGPRAGGPWPDTISPPPPPPPAPDGHRC